MWKIDNYAASRIVHVGSRIHELHCIALDSLQFVEKMTYCFRFHGSPE